MSGRRITPETEITLDFINDNELIDLPLKDGILMFYQCGGLGSGGSGCSNVPL